MLAVTLTASQKSIYDVTTYSFVLSGNQRLTDSCVIVFTFPLSTGISYQAPISCTVGNGFKKTPNCAVSGGTTTDLIVTASCVSTGTIDASSPSLYNINIVNMKNSFSAQSISNINVQTKTGATLIDQGFGSITFIPKVLPASWGRLTPADPSVGVYNVLTLQVTITTPVPYDGQIIFVLPKWDSQGKKSMTEQVASCTASSDLSGNSPTCAATLNSPKANFDSVTITNALLSYQTSGIGYVPTGKLLEIAINNIKNPPTLQTYNTYEIYTADKNGNLIETCSGLSLFLQNVGSLNSMSSVTLKGNTGINELGTYNFFFKLGNPIPAGGWVRVVFPSDLTVVSPVFAPLVQISSSATITQQSINLNGVSKVAIDIKNGITAYVQDSSGIFFEISGIRNPSSTKVTSSFEFYTSDSLNSWIDKLSTGLTVQATQRTLRSVKVYPSDMLGVLQYAKVYQLQFTTASTLSTANSIIIKFPTASFSVSSRTCTVNGTIASQQFPSQTYSCIAASDTQTITIKNFLSTQLAASSTFILTIQNLYIRNPATVSESSPIEVYTALDGNKVDYDNSQKYKATWSPITLANAVSNSYQTNQVDQIYTFTIVPSGYLIQSAVINITFPDEVTISDETKLTNQCGLDKLSGFKNSIDCSIKNSNSVLIRNGFTSSTSDDPPTLIVSLPGIKNPRALGIPTQSFQIYIYEGTDTKKILYNISTGVSITMTSLSTIKQVQVLRDSLINGDYNNFTFKIQFSSQVLSGDFLIIDIPKINPISFSNTTKCFGISSNLFYNQQCTVGDNQLKIILQTRFLRRQLQSGFSQQQASIIVTNVKNPKSLQKTSSFVITQYTSSGYKVEMSTSNITLQNNQSAELGYSQVTISPISMQTGQTTSYVVSFVPTNYIQDMQIVLTVPAELKVSQQIQCNGISGVGSEISCQYNSNNRTIIIKNGFLSSSNSIKFSISNFTNPDSEIKTGNFRFQTFTSDNFSLDYRDQDLYLDFKCSLPCKTCLSKNNTACQTCFTDSIRGLPMHLYNNYCITDCPLFTFSEIKDLVCKSCFDKKACMKCSDEGKKSCKQCTTDFTLINGECTKVNDQTYFYPIIILSVLWMIASVFITLNWEKSRYLTIVILGLTILEIAMLGLELSMHSFYKFNQNFTSGIIYGVALQYPANLAFMIFYYVLLRNLEEIKESRFLDKKLHTSVLIVSGALNQRAFKLLYSNLGNKPYLGLNQVFEGQKVKCTYYFIQLLSIVPSVLLAVNAFSNMMQAQTMKLKFPQQIDIERITLSVVVCLFMLIELCYLQKQRPEIIENAISKYHGSETQEKRIKTDTKRVIPNQDQSYNEIPSMSFVTHQDGPLIPNTSEDEVKRKAMKQILDNLKQVKPELIEERIQELLKERHKLSPLRKSDQGNPLGKWQSKTTRSKIMQDGEDERRVLTEPPSPKVGDKVTGDIIEDMRNLQAFPMDPKIKIDMKDQEIAANRNSLDREWEDLQREKDQFAQMLEEFQQEKSKFKQEILEVKKKSASSTPRQSSIEEVNRKEIQTHRNKHQMLDAVRESQSELLEDHHIRSARNKTVSKDRIIPHSMSGTKQQSIRSLKSETYLRLTPSPHKCHGQSQSTIKSINKLRQKTESSKNGSVNGSQYNIARLRQQQQVNDQIFTSPRNLQQYLNSNLDEQHILTINDNSQQVNPQTKIYYSEKTESSVDDLMEETPSTYNIQNGRFEGKSQGGNVFALQNNQPNQKIVPRVNQNKSSSKKKKKIFREETTQEVETITEYQMEGQADTRSHSVARLGGQQRAEQISRAAGEVSNISFENQISKSTFKKKRVSVRVDGIIPMSTERIKALEAAYLTKLHRPKKAIPSSRMYDQGQLERNYTEIINIHKQKTMSQRDDINNGGLNNLGLTQMKVLPIPQINNFNQ